MPPEGIPLAGRNEARPQVHKKVQSRIGLRRGIYQVVMRPDIVVANVWDDGSRGEYTNEIVHGQCIQGLNLAFCANDVGIRVMSTASQRYRRRSYFRLTAYTNLAESPVQIIKSMDWF